MEKRFNRPKFDILPVIEDRIQYLAQIKAKIESEYKKMPEGSILVAPGRSENSFRYYLRRNPQEKMGIYLDSSKGKIKKQYSAKKYYSVLIKEVDDEIKKLNKIKKMGLMDSIIFSFEKINLGVRKLISPINIDDDLYIKMWIEEPYERLGFDKNDKSSFYSDRGERMRSKSEVLIANELNRRGVPYKYECPVTTVDGKSLYPDFTILDVKNRREKYWEHLGKMGDMSYVARNIWKIDEYKKMNILLGLDLFLTYENETNSIRTVDIVRTIEAIVKG